MPGFDIDDLRYIVALPFKSRNKYCLDEKDFIYTLSFDLRIALPSVCRDILKMGVDANLLSLKEGVVRPSLSILDNRNIIDYKEIKGGRRL